MCAVFQPLTEKPADEPFAFAPQRFARVLNSVDEAVDGQGAGLQVQFFDVQTFAPHIHDALVRLHHHDVVVEALHIDYAFRLQGFPMLQGKLLLMHAS